MPYASYTGWKNTLQLRKTLEEEGRWRKQKQKFSEPAARSTFWWGQTVNKVGGGLKFREHTVDTMIHKDTRRRRNPSEKTKKTLWQRKIQHSHITFKPQKINFLPLNKTKPKNNNKKVWTENYLLKLLVSSNQIAEGNFNSLKKVQLKTPTYIFVYV